VVDDWLWRVKISKEFECHYTDDEFEKQVRGTDKRTKRKDSVETTSGVKRILEKDEAGVP